MLNFTRIPAPRVALVDIQTGVVSNEWFRFFNNLFTIAYSSTGTVTGATYGSATEVAQITLNEFGSIVGIQDVAIALDASQIISGILNGIGYTNGAITSSTINSSVIGGTTPAAGTFTTATVTSINRMAIVAPATSSTLAIANGKTFTTNNTLTLNGTDSTAMTFPSTSAVIARTDAAQTFEGTQTFNGLIKPQQATTAGAPAYVKGAIYFDLTLNKLRVGGATAWETITSV